MSTEINFNNLKQFSINEIIPNSKLKMLFEVHNYKECELSAEEQEIILRKVWRDWVDENREDYENLGFNGPFPGNDLNDEIPNQDFVSITINGNENVRALYLYKPENILFSFNGYYDSYMGYSWTKSTFRIVEKINPSTVYNF
jgi:hypothetical protein